MDVEVFVKVCLAQLYDWEFNRNLLAMRREWRRRNNPDRSSIAWLAVVSAIVDHELPTRRK